MRADLPEGLVAAVPRSPLHIQFLLDNGEDPDLVLYRTEALRDELERYFPGRSLYLGREARPGRSLRSLLDARRANHGYYADIARRLSATPIRRLILFLEGEPLERFLMSLPQVRYVELWEEGLSHYVDLTHPLWYAMRGLAQWAAGFYPRDILTRRIDRSGIVVRDRFGNHRLSLQSPREPSQWRSELLLVGSPLVEDGLLGRRRFIRGLTRITTACPIPVRYLPHPREDIARLGEDLSDFTDLVLETGTEGLMLHAARFGYAGYAAAVSTGLLDIGRPERSAFVANFFGLARMTRVLREWPENPIRVVEKDMALADIIKSVP